jgi:hypothetical protein
MRNSGVTREHKHYKTGRLCPGASMRSRERIDEKADASKQERRVAGTSPIVLLRPASEPVPPALEEALDAEAAGNGGIG